MILWAQKSFLAQRNEEYWKLLEPIITVMNRFTVLDLIHTGRFVWHAHSQIPQDTHTHLVMPREEQFFSPPALDIFSHLIKSLNFCPFNQLTDCISFPSLYVYSQKGQRVVALCPLNNSRCYSVLPEPLTYSLVITRWCLYSPVTSGFLLSWLSCPVSPFVCLADGRTLTRSPFSCSLLSPRESKSPFLYSVKCLQFFCCCCLFVFS